ncbi:hypothetical protein SYK_32160 [Pseudodesulfovibrio nedwellii]|uniref:Uncharacterized protein n=1 Tax=Pseudodesulfovibrio nedwellii TaxID=2973072 RepID=A0ABN6SAJ3_9BACT|nr:hypothetical protein [Pseudodesulfovibrio nedwellii]BDQ38856.1 hypothetical protein SYK_32160 [Pseudodesulfovibrio nedwellii]
MANFASKMIRFIETLTTHGEYANATEDRDPDTHFRAPQGVQDLMIFGAKAGEAAEKLDEGDATPVGENRANYSDISALAAVAATRASLWNSMEEWLNRTINPIIASLDTSEFAEKWSHDEFKHHDFIASIAYGATQEIIRDIPMALTMKALLLSLKKSDNMAEQVSFLMPYLKDQCAKFMSTSGMPFRQLALGTAISIVENSTDINETWATDALQALQTIDLDSNYDLTEENKLIADQVHDAYWEEVTPKSIATFAAWLTAICRYTEFGNTIEMLYMNSRDTQELEDHQGDVDENAPDGLAA